MQHDLQEPERRVHKIFLEEESKSKVKLRRLDEDDDEDKKLVVKESRPSKAREEVKDIHAKQSHTRPAHTVPSVQAVKTELPVKTEALPSDAKKVMEERSDIPAPKVVNEACEEPLPDKDRILSEGSSKAVEDEGSSERTEDQSQESSTAGSSKPEKKARVLGPTLPPHLAHLKTSSQVWFVLLFVIFCCCSDSKTPPTLTTRCEVCKFACSCFCI